MVSATTATEATSIPPAATAPPQSAAFDGLIDASPPPPHSARHGLARLAPWAILLGVLTSLSRLPFRSHYLFSWDSANFALALDQYNVTFHQPQPPGYPLYVASAWLVRHVLHEANASYVALSIVASGFAVAFLVLAAGRLYGRSTALLAGALLASSSVFWSQGEVAYPYAFLACFSALVGWLCLEVRAEDERQRPKAEGRSQRSSVLSPQSSVLEPIRSERSWRAPALVILTGLVLGIAAGYRSELLPFLLLLWLVAAVRRPGSWWARMLAALAGGAAAALAVIAWYVPMVEKSGGWTAYQAATGGYYAYFIETTSGAGKLLLGVLENTRALVGYLYNGLGLALLPVLYFCGRIFSPHRLVVDRRVRFLALWLLPPLVFYVTVHIGNPGYVLSFLPALCIVAAESLLGLLEDVRQAAAELASRLWRPSWLHTLGRSGWLTPAAVAATAVIAMSNVALFAVANGEGRYKEIRQIDRILAQQVAYVREQYPPQSTLLVAYDRSRQYHYYLPQYPLKLLFDVAVAGAVTDTSRYWERRTDFTVPAGMSAVLFPDLGRNTSDQPGLVQQVALGSGVDLFVAHVQPGDQVRYGYQYASVQRPGASLAG